MARYDAQAANPERYEKASAEQMELIRQLRGRHCAARLCPYCDQKISLLYPGHHGAARMKCPNCGEEVAFPPITISHRLPKAVCSRS